MKQIILVMLACIVTINANAQAPSITNIQLNGTVQDGEQNIPFARVIIENSSKGTIADAEGNYTIVLPQEGEYNVKASAIGYVSQSRSIKVNANKTATLNFNLSDDMIGLEEVVVSANRYAEQKKYSSVIVNSLNSRISDISQSNSVLGSLDFSPGLRTEDNCQNCGFPQVRMNGMEGSYTQVLINSRPIFSGLMGVYGLDIFPASMIERTEIVRGGGSALYGGNAIAGTINIITKEASQNEFGFSSDVGIDNMDGQKAALDRTINIHGSVISKNEKAGLILYASARDKNPTDVNGDGFSDRVAVKNQTFGFGSFYKPTQKSKISLNFFKIHDFRRGGNKFEYLPHETDITEQAEHNITGINLNFDLYTNNYSTFTAYSSAQFTDRESYYGAEQDLSAYGATDDITASNGIEYTQRISFLDSKLLLGADHKYGRLTDKKLGSNGLPNTLISEQLSSVAGSFIQYEMSAGIFTSSFGLRTDNYTIKDLVSDNPDIKGTVVSPRMSLLAKLHSDLQFRAGYAKGYRAPQIYDEDLHIESSGARRVTHVNSPDLRQETSHSINSSLRYSSILGQHTPIQTELVAEAFYTKLQDPFSNEFSETNEAGNVIFTRINSENGATVYGGNLELNLGFPNNVLLQAAYTRQKSRYDIAQQWGEEETSTSRDFIKSPDSYGYLSLSYTPKRGLSGSLSGIYTGSMLVPHFGLDPQTNNPEELEAIENNWVITGERLEKTPAFFNIGAKITYAFILNKTLDIKISTGVKNIFNQMQNFDSGIYRDPGYVYGPSYGRMLTFGIEICTGH
jgi:outer membrane receptor for ferrienterochelin and colicins